MNLSLARRGDFFDHLQREVDQLFGDFFGVRPLSPSHRGTFAAINSWEDDDNVYVESEIPGLRQDQFEVHVVGDELTITGERRLPDEGGEGQKRHRAERFHGKFSRTVTLPVAVNPEGAEAKLENGVLTIRLPKSGLSKARKISVE